MSVQFPLISEVLREYQATKKVAETDIEQYDQHIRIGMATRKGQAQEEVQTLARKLRELVDLDTAALLPYGPEANVAAYAALAEDEGDAIVVNANALYIDLASMVEPFLTNRTFTVETGRALFQGLYQVAGDVGLLSYIAPLVHSAFGSVLPTKDDLVQTVKSLVRSGNGDDFAAVYVSYLVAKRILTEGYAQNVVPVVVAGLTPDEAKGEFAQRLFGGRTIAVDVKDPPEKNDIIIGFKHLKPMFKRSAAVQAAFNLAKARAARKSQAENPAPASADANTSETPLTDPEAE